MGILIAGLGNIFNGDDGFGVEVADCLLRQDWPDDVQVADFGIRGVHLAYQLLDGYDLVVIVDAVSRGGAAGSLYVIDHHPDEHLPAPADDKALMDAHDLGPDGVLALVPALGGILGRVVVVVAGSVEAAAKLVGDIVRDARVSPGN
jgi:hydrogenase maturation protease